MSGTISFIMPAYKSLYLEEAIKSIVSQTSPEWELVVVDDCSPEDLRSIVERFNDPRITYYRNEENIGGKDLVAQWNHSISFAKGDWIVLAGDDDIYDSDFVKEVCRLIEKYPKVDLIRSRVKIIDENGHHLWDDGVFHEFEMKEEFLSDWLTAKALTCIGNFVFRKSELERIGGYVNFPCGFCSDIATPILLSKNGVVNSEKELFRFRQSRIHLSSNPTRLPDKLKATTLFYEWLQNLDYQAPGYGPCEIHNKCIFDYFNQVIKFVELKDLLCYLQQCILASPLEKSIMAARWFKRKIWTTPFKHTHK